MHVPTIKIFIHPNRRTSTGMDSGQEDSTKHIKVEHGSDVHNHKSKQPHHPQSAIPIQHIFSESTHQPAVQIAESPPNKKWEERIGARAPPEEYVPHPTLDSYTMSPSRGPEPWSPYATRNPMVSLISYAHDSDVDPQVFSHPVTNNPSANFAFDDEYSLYETTWNAAQDQPMGQSGPT